MLLQSKFSKIASLSAAATLAALAASGTASAAVPQQPTPDVQATSTVVQADPNQALAHRLYLGRVIARTGLLVHSAPSRRSPVIGALPYGSVVRIECKVNGDWVDGNPRWYKLANGRWAWASARYIVNIGDAPRWCYFD